MSSVVTREESAIWDLVEARAQALRDKDAAALIGLQAPDAVIFTLAPPLAISGGDSDGLVEWLATWDGLIGYDIQQLNVAVSGDLAFTHSLDRMHGNRVDGPATDLWFRNTLGFMRVRGRWLITHEHQSVPFAMDGSDRALLDLTP